MGTEFEFVYVDDDVRFANKIETMFFGDIELPFNVDLYQNDLEKLSQFKDEETRSIYLLELALVKSISLLKDYSNRSDHLEIECERYRDVMKRLAKEKYNKENNNN